MMTKFSLVAMGGTFDILHKGHLALLDEAFSISDNVIIGLASDEFANKRGKKLNHNYSQRSEALKQLIEKKFQHKSYTISKLDSDFGPAVTEGNVQALVVSDETAHKGDTLNKMRKEKNLDPVKTVVVPMILAQDGKRISTARIRNSEIDTQGNLV
jgi:pantetheine-phosphate adenylyltransferase